MSLMADIKVALRVTSTAYDSEVETLIGAALYDMERAGVNPVLLGLSGDIAEGAVLTEGNALVKKGVIAYCKANFGYDNAEAPRFDDSYNRVVVDLLNSSDNIAAIAESGESE